MFSSGARKGRTLASVVIGLAVITLPLIAESPASAAPPAPVIVQSPIDASIDSSTGEVYVIADAPARVVVLDPTSGEAVREVLLPSVPRDIELDSANRLGYIAQSGGSITVVDLDAAAIIGSIITGTREISDIAVNPAAGKLYVGLIRMGNLLVVDTASASVEATVFTNYGERNSVTFDEQSNRVYVGGGSALVSLDADTYAVLSSTPSNIFLSSVAVDPVNRQLFAAGGLGIYEYDLDTGAYTGLIRVANSPTGRTLAVSSDFRRIYAPTSDGRIAVVDAAGRAELPSTEQVGLLATSRFIVNQQSGLIVVVTPDTNTVSFFLPPSLSGDAPDSELGSYSYSYALPTSPETVVSITDGALPDGLTLSTNGDLTGNATADGAFTFTVTARNPLGPDISVTDSIEIRATPTMPPQISGTAGPLTVGEAVSFRYTVSGDPAPSVFVATGSLPPGLTLGADGSLTGVPTTAGTYAITLNATNNVGPDATLTDTLVVAAAEQPVDPPTAGETPSAAPEGPLAASGGDSSGPIMLGFALIGAAITVAAWRRAGANRP